MTPTRKIMAFLSVVVGAGAIKWAVNEWKGASHGKRGSVIGLTLAALIVAVCAFLRAIGF